MASFLTLPFELHLEILDNLLPSLPLKRDETYWDVSDPEESDNEDVHVEEEGDGNGMDLGDDITTVPQLSSSKHRPTPLECSEAGLLQPVLTLLVALDHKDGALLNIYNVYKLGVCKFLGDLYKDILKMPRTSIMDDGSAMALTRAQDYKENDPWLTLFEEAVYLVFDASFDTDHLFEDDNRPDDGRIWKAFASLWCDEKFCAVPPPPAAFAFKDGIASTDSAALKLPKVYLCWLENLHLVFRSYTFIEGDRDCAGIMRQFAYHHLFDMVQRTSSNAEPVPEPEKGVASLTNRHCSGKSDSVSAFTACGDAPRCSFCSNKDYKFCWPCGGNGYPQTWAQRVADFFKFGRIMLDGGAYYRVFAINATTWANTAYRSAGLPGPEAGLEKYDEPEWFASRSALDYDFSLKYSWEEIEHYYRNSADE
ncbi:hypothetical protein BJ508DRAFT_367000 [Ascobolus immersus RN42]|uniref:Uncharacterized protein n=1 Tax=Ascobolus immersus RN42 TaxID=1160509 RepID=A0A3N4HM10_ASCIM|nr:hypothetical protein BJ508DRAFT_367000 [Ascobolus immersus RN42]